MLAGRRRRNGCHKRAGARRPEGGRHTGNSLMRDAGVDQEVRMREVGHAGRDINDRYTHVLIEAHLAAAEQTAALIREAGKTAP
jgi:integrase